jgi:hypothetical protein
MKDGDFLADAANSLLEIRSVSGEDVEKLVRDVYQPPPAIVRRAADILR